MSTVPRIRAWRFSSARPGSVAANGSASMSRNAACAGSIGTVMVRMPGFRATAWASGEDGGDERRVEPARQPDEHVGQPVLDHVVAGAERERFVDLTHGRKLGL